MFFHFPGMCFEKTVILVDLNCIWQVFYYISRHCTGVCEQYKEKQGLWAVLRCLFKKSETDWEAAYTLKHKIATSQ